MFWPVVRFRSLTGEEVTIVGAEPSLRSFVAGTSVQVVYDLADPSRADVAGGRTGMTHVVAGVVVALFGIVMYVMLHVFTAGMPQLPASG